MQTRKKFAAKAVDGCSLKNFRSLTKIVFFRMNTIYGASRT